MESVSEKVKAIAAAYEVVRGSPVGFRHVETGEVFTTKDYPLPRLMLAKHHRTSEMIMKRALAEVVNRCNRETVDEMLFR